MAHGWLCTCKKCSPSIFDSVFGTPKVKDSKKRGPNQNYYGGRGKPDGLGHGHYNPNTGFNRRPVKNPLGNAAINGSSRKPMGDRTPKWK